MMWRDVIGLIAVTTSQSATGSVTTTDGLPREVFANKKSVKYTEFYSALAVGVKPDIIFEIREAEYNNEPKLKYGDIVYHVVRTYSKDGEKLELTCSRFPMGG